MSNEIQRGSGSPIGGTDPFCDSELRPPDDLAEWLRRLETLHPSEIELGLQRVRSVAERLGLNRPAPLVVTVAGTNGKGSSVAMLEAVLRAAGRRVGAYTSPHLLRYNERTRVDGRVAEDHVLCRAFERVEAARGTIPLTYFEFGTLATLDLFQRSSLDVALLEVGLGGRLDAVNIVDPDIALITAIGLDHTDWLGPDRESIGREKAGVFRFGSAAVVADPEPPASVLAAAAGLLVDLRLAGRDFGYRAEVGSWCWWGNSTVIEDLPLPALCGAHQIRNAAGVLAVLSHPRMSPQIGLGAIRDGLLRVRAAGRLEVHDGPVTTVMDVAHNPDGAAVLASHLAGTQVPGVTLAVVGVLSGKDTAGMFRILDPVVDRWYFGGLQGTRAQEAPALQTSLSQIRTAADSEAHPSVAGAYRTAMRDSRPGDRVVVFGSFQTVAAVMAQRT